MINDTCLMITHLEKTQSEELKFIILTYLNRLNPTRIRVGHWALKG